MSPVPARHRPTLPGAHGPPNVLITGCSSGIGLCCARGLRDRGYRVFAAARRPRDVTRLSGEGLEGVELDLDDPGSVEAAAARVLERTGGRLDALFNNAGYQQPGALEDLSRSALRAQFETNVFGLHDLTRRIIPAMRARGAGRIVQNSSVLGIVALRFRGAYNASKFALEGLTDTLRLELADSGVHVCLIEPGPVTSRLGDRALAAFRAHVDLQTSIHRDAYRRLERRLDPDGKATPFTLPPEAVFAKLVHALESPRPRLRYRVTRPAQVFAVLKRVLPGRALDSLLKRVS